MNELHDLPKLGVGLTYQPGLRPAMEAAESLIDFYELSPDILCHERVYHDQRALHYHPTLLAEALAWCERRPIVVHGLGLSIGSACGWNEDYLRILDEFGSHRSFPWHSEHLGFLHAADADGQALHAGVQLPLPFSEEALDLIVPRVDALLRRHDEPFLLENTTFYLPGSPTENGFDEITFLNALTERSGCGLLLDLYNFHCNAVNFGFDAFEALSRLDLDRVVEIHIAGGTTHEGFLMDVHSDVVPRSVWQLLEWVVPRTPNLAAIVYEHLEQAVHVVGVEGVRRQLERAHAVWNSRPTALTSGGRDAAV